MLIKGVVGGGGDNKTSSTATASLLLSLKPVSEIPLVPSNNGAKLLELRSSSGDAVTTEDKAGNSKKTTGTHLYLNKNITKPCKIQQPSDQTISNQDQLFAKLISQHTTSERKKEISFGDFELDQSNAVAKALMPLTAARHNWAPNNRPQSRQPTNDDSNFQNDGLPIKRIPSSSLGRPSSFSSRISTPSCWLTDPFLPLKTKHNPKNISLKARRIRPLTSWERDPDSANQP